MEAKMRYQAQFEKLLGMSLKPNRKGQVVIKCPFLDHDDKRPSFSINLQTGLWRCFGCGRSGNFYQLAESLKKPDNFYHKEKTMQEPKLLNDIIEAFHKNLTPASREYWHNRGVNDETLDMMKIGYEPNRGFYVLPYIDEKGDCRFYKAVNIQKDQRWYPEGLDDAIRIYNIVDIKIAKEEGNTLYVSEGEKDFLIIKQYGYPCVGISGVNGFKEEYAPLFDGVKDIVVCYDNDDEGQAGGKRVVELLGGKARLLRWPAGSPKDINDLYLADKDKFKEYFDSLIRQSKPTRLLNPISSKFDHILDYCRQTAEDRLSGIRTNYARIDTFTLGLRGIVILGGPPKIGKSTFSLCIGSNVAENGFPMLYCDFENGTFKLILKLLSRISKIEVRYVPFRITAIQKSPQFEPIKERFLKIGQNIFIHRPSLKDVSCDDRDPMEALKSLLTRYVTCIRDELQHQKPILIIIDSLQKLPLWNMSDRRSGIDSWLRAFEWARDNLNVTFLIISELARGTYNAGSDVKSIEAFKESGDIEYTADLAIQMTKGKDENGNDTIELHAVANRDGEIGLIGSYKPIYEFSDFEELPDRMVREIIRSCKRNGTNGSQQ